MAKHNGKGNEKHSGPITRENVARRAMELGYEVGYYGHDDFIGWVEEAVHSIEKDAKKLGMLEEARQIYQMAKEKGKDDAEKARSEGLSEIASIISGGSEVQLGRRNYFIGEKRRKQEIGISTTKKPSGPLHSSAVTYVLGLGSRFRSPGRLIYGRRKKKKKRRKRR